jgi:N-acetyl-gamma-glutamyl-phosphate reductase
MPARKVGIFGGSGLTGGELCRLLLGHPRLSLSFVHSRHHAGEPLSNVHPALAGMTDLRCTGEEPAAVAREADVAFVVLGHGESAALVAELGEYPGLLIDLTGDHRLKDASVYDAWYGMKHPAPAQPGRFVYGLVETNRPAIREARRIANPGCFATATALALAPLARERWIEGSAFVAAVTGSSGAGITPTPTTHHPYRDANLFAYKVFRHQHEPEIAQELSRLAGAPTDLILTTHSGPFVRGIHATAHARLGREVPVKELRALYARFYAGSPFVRMRDEAPHLKSVVGSNFCDLHVTARGRDVVVLSVIDNLVKGAAGQAIQNLNLAAGFDEKEGLWTPPLYP